MTPISELLIRLKDKTSPDTIKNARLTKSGDVIVVRPYPEKWGTGDISNPDWVIVQTDMPLTEAEAFIAVEPGDLTLNPGLKIRQNNVTVFSIPGQFKKLPKVEQDKFVPPYVLPIQISAADLRTGSKTKPASANPFIL
jgi:hypothetical protein